MLGKGLEGKMEGGKRRDRGTFLGYSSEDRKGKRDYSPHLVYADNASICQHHGTSFEIELPSCVLDHRGSQTFGDEKGVCGVCVCVCEENEGRGIE